MWFKFLFFLTSYWGIYSVLITTEASAGLRIFYCILLGFVSTCVAYNICHDAAHGTFSSNKMINNIIYYFTFNMLGTNAYLWKIRHQHAHHIFPNVPGCDVDIEGNNILRLGPHSPWKEKYKYQVFYAPILYSIYTLYWVFIKDFVILSWPTLANLKNIKHSYKQAFSLVFAKLIYFVYMLLIPTLVMDISFGEVFIGFIIMQTLFWT